VVGGEGKSCGDRRIEGRGPERNVHVRAEVEGKGVGGGELKLEPLCRAPPCWDVKV